MTHLTADSSTVPTGITRCARGGTGAGRDGARGASITGALTGSTGVSTGKTAAASSSAGLTTIFTSGTVTARCSTDLSVGMLSNLALETGGGASGCVVLTNTTISALT